MTAPPGEGPGRCAALGAPHLNGHLLMGYTEDILNDIRGQIDARPEPLAQARARLDLVRSSAIGFTGARHTYRSGSLAQHTFIHPVGDGDGGVVLDRRVYPRLGPDGGGETPAAITGKLCALLGPAWRCRTGPSGTPCAPRGPAARTACR